MECELLILCVEEVGYARNDGIICPVVAYVGPPTVLRKRTYLAPGFEPELQREP